jgi:hypothetical protein
MATTPHASQSRRVANHQITLPMAAKHIASVLSVLTEISKSMFSSCSPSFAAEILEPDNKFTTDDIHLFGSVSNLPPSTNLHSKATTKGPKLAVRPPSTNSLNFVGEFNQQIDHLFAVPNPNQLRSLQFILPSPRSTDADFNLLTLIHPTIITILDQIDHSNRAPSSHQPENSNPTNLASNLPTSARSAAPSTCLTSVPQQEPTCPPNPVTQLAQQIHSTIPQSVLANKISVNIAQPEDRFSQPTQPCGHCTSSHSQKQTYPHPLTKFRSATRPTAHLVISPT